MKVLSLLKSYADSNRLSEIGIGLAGSPIGSRIGGVEEGITL
jgi:hypothetical protein